MKRRFLVLCVMVAALAAAVCGCTSNSSAPPSQAASSQQADAPSQSEALVPQALPEWIEIPGKLERTEMNPKGIVPIDGVVDPVDNRPVFRLDSNRPGSNSPGVTLVYGHSYTDKNGAFVPFMALEQVEEGDAIVMGTPKGELTYKISRKLLVPKGELSTNTEVYENVPNRVAVITCDTIDGKDTSDNYVLFGELVKSSKLS